MDFVIPLSRGYETIVDEKDYDELSKHSWHAAIGGGGNVYARRVEKGKTIRMQRQIMNPEKNMVVDHINGDSLDNRRSNLRVCTQEQNNQNKVNIRLTNSSQYRGVWFYNARKKWRATISVNNKTVHLGQHRSEIDAALAYNEAAIKHYGEYAILNEIPNDQALKERGE